MLTINVNNCSVQYCDVTLFNLSDLIALSAHLEGHFSYIKRYYTLSCFYLSQDESACQCWVIMVGGNILIFQNQCTVSYNMANLCKITCKIIKRMLKAKTLGPCDHDMIPVSTPFRFNYRPAATLHIQYFCYQQASNDSQIDINGSYQECLL